MPNPISLCMFLTVYILYCVCWCLKVHLYEYKYVRNQRGSCGDQFSLHKMWVMEIEFRVSRLITSAFLHLAILLTHTFMFELLHNLILVTIAKNLDNLFKCLLTTLLPLFLFVVYINLFTKLILCFFLKCSGNRLLVVSLIAPLAWYQHFLYINIRMSYLTLPIVQR